MISQDVWFYYKVLIFRINGAHMEKAKKIDNSFLNQNQRLILNPKINGYNLWLLNQSLPVLQDYICKASRMKYERSYESYKNDLVPHLFHLISQVYKIKEKQETGQKSITFCAALMICLLENFQKDLPQNVYIHIWQFTKINLLKFRSRNQKIVNRQLIGLLLWVNPSILIIVQRQKMFQKLVAEIIRESYHFEHQRGRVILGINSLLLFPQKPSFLLSKLADLFKANMRLVQINTNKRLKIQIADSQNIQANRIIDDEREDEIDIVQLFQFGRNDYCQNGVLNLADQIWQFQETLQRLSTEQDHLYAQLILTVPVGEVDRLRQKIRMAPKKHL